MTPAILGLTVESRLNLSYSVRCASSSSLIAVVLFELIVG